MVIDLVTLLSARAGGELGWLSCIMSWLEVLIWVLVSGAKTFLGLPLPLFTVVVCCSVAVSVSVVSCCSCISSSALYSVW